MYNLTTALTSKRIKEIAERTNYPKLQIEFLGWLMDTAHILCDRELILKGGTAVQQFIREPCRRISMDLDYNIGGEMSLDEIREFMDGEKFRGGGYNRFTGAITYYRMAPTIYKAEIRFEGEKLNAHLIKVQLNSRIVSKEPETVDFNILPGILDDYSFKQKTLSLEMLLANKIVISAKSDKLRVGRLHYKDLFDVLALTNYPARKIDYKQVYIDIGRDLRIRGSDLYPADLIESCARNLSLLKEGKSEGFFSSYRIPTDMIKEMSKLIDNSKSILEELRLLH